MPRPVSITGSSVPVPPTELELNSIKPLVIPLGFAFWYASFAVRVRIIVSPDLRLVLLAVNTEFCAETAAGWIKMPESDAETEALLASEAAIDCVPEVLRINPEMVFEPESAAVKLVSGGNVACPSLEVKCALPR